MGVCVEKVDEEEDGEREVAKAWNGLGAAAVEEGELFIESKPRHGRDRQREPGRERGRRIARAAVGSRP